MAQLDFSARSAQINFLHFALRVLLLQYQQFLHDGQFLVLLCSLDLVDFFEFLYLGLGATCSRTIARFCHFSPNRILSLCFLASVVQVIEHLLYHGSISVSVFSLFLIFSQFLAYALEALSPCLGRLHLVLLPRMSSDGVYPLSSWLLLHVSKPIYLSTGFPRMFFRVFTLLSANPLDCGYIGLDVICLKSHSSANCLNSVLE